MILSLTQMNQIIDLNLAVNYLPACECVVKSVLLLGLIGVLHTASVLPGYVFVCLVLAFDRMHSNYHILDVNAVLFALFSAHVVSCIREWHNGSWHRFLWAEFCMSLVWSVVALCALVYQPFQCRFTETFLNLARACVIFFVSALSFCAPDDRDYSLRIVRGVCYFVFCIAWVYVVGIHKKGLMVLNEGTEYMVIFFSPVLYCDKAVACLYAVMVLVFIVYQFMGGEIQRAILLDACKHREDFSSNNHAYYASAQESQCTIEYGQVDCGESVEELEELCRAARAARGQTAVLN